MYSKRDEGKMGMKRRRGGLEERRTIFTGAETRKTAVVWLGDCAYGWVLDKRKLRWIDIEEGRGATREMA